MQYDAKHDCWVTVTPVLPAAVKGATGEEPDGTNIVLINECLCDEAKKKAYEHEQAHIKNGDLHSEEPVHEIEERMEDKK